MKTKIFFLFIFFLFSCNKQSTNQINAKQIVENTHVHTQEEKTIWTCPMHPQIKSDHPGNCPICGMKLVLAKPSLENISSNKSDIMPEGHTIFNLSQERQQLIGVKTSVVEKKELFKSIEAAGKIAFDPELYTAQNDYNEAIRQKERVKDSALSEVKHSAQSMVESAKLRLRILGLSDEQIKKLGTNGTTGSELLIPKPGESLWVYAEIFEMDLSFIREGLSVTISGSSIKGGDLKGKVVSVDRVINPSTRTAKVRILIPDTKASLRPEAYVDVTILSPMGEQVVVPFDAIIDTGKEAWVFVVTDKNDFDPRLVTILNRAGNEVAIGSGVHPGEKIVTAANFLIDSESRIKSVIENQRKQK